MHPPNPEVALNWFRFVIDKRSNMYKIHSIEKRQQDTMKLFVNQGFSLIELFFFSNSKMIEILN